MTYHTWFRLPGSPAFQRLTLKSWVEPGDETIQGNVLRHTRQMVSLGNYGLSWDVHCVSCTRQCPMLYISSGIQTLYFLWHLGINSIIIIHAENVIPNGNPMNKPYVVHDHNLIVPDPTIFLRYLATYMYSSLMESISICIDSVYFSAHNFMHQQNRPIIMVPEFISLEFHELGVLYSICFLWRCMSWWWWWGTPSDMYHVGHCINGWVLRFEYGLKVSIGV